jgi:hypothetical protein
MVEHLRVAVEMDFDFAGVVRKRFLSLLNGRCNGKSNIR